MKPSKSWRPKKASWRTSLNIKWIVPFHADEISRILARSKKVIVVENNYSGQFARYHRSETGFEAHGHIRKYDGEPFMPHHIVEAVKRPVGGQSEIVRPHPRGAREQELKELPWIHIDSCQ